MNNIRSILQQNNNNNSSSSSSSNNNSNNKTQNSSNSNKNNNNYISSNNHYLTEALPYCHLTEKNTVAHGYSAAVVVIVAANIIVVILVAVAAFVLGKVAKSPRDKISQKTKSPTSMKKDKITHLKITQGQNHPKDKITKGTKSPKRQNLLLSFMETKSPILKSPTLKSPKIKNGDNRRHATGRA